MAQRPVLIGEQPNDRSGDAVREAFEKLNGNDAELYGIGAACAADIEALASLVAQVKSPPELIASGPVADALAGKQPLDATLSALATLVTVADRFIYATGSDQFALATLTAFSRGLLAGADGAAWRQALGLVLGTNVQAWDADLDAIAALATTSFGRGLLTQADGPSTLLTLGALALAGGTMAGTLTLSGDPTAALHAATKQYVDNLVQGLDAKASVRVASTANLTLSGLQTIDGIAVAAGERVLVKDQTTASQNGLYVAASGAWARASDMDVWTEVPSAFVLAESGTVNADTGWVCTSDVGGTLGTTAVTWVKFGTLAGLAPLLSPAFTGIPTAPTASQGTNTTQLATTAFVIAEVLARALQRSGDTLTGALNLAPPVTLASAATVAIGAAASNSISVTGTTAITAFDTIAAGARRLLTFAAAGLVLTYNATSLILPTAQNITTQAGDVAEFVSLGSGNWRCVRYQRSDGTALAAATAATGPITGIRTITAADTIVASDKGKLLVFSGGGTFTVAFTAAATLGANFYCYVQKLDGAGTVTLDPNGAETIDGRATINVYQESFTITGDGTALRTISRPRGWILLGRTVLTGQTLSALTISQGFIDPEMASILYRFQNLTFSGTGETAILRVAKNGSLVTTNSYLYSQWYNQGNAAPTGNAGTATFMPVAQVPGSGPVSGEICLSGLQSASAAGQSIAVQSRSSGSPPNIFSSGGYEVSNFAVQSFNLSASAGSTISAITFNLWGERQ